MLPTITVDIGTTSVKLCMFDADGEARSPRHATPRRPRQDAWGEIYDLESVLTDVIIGFIRGLEPIHRAIREADRDHRRRRVGRSGPPGPLPRLADDPVARPPRRGLPRPLSAADRTLIYRVTGLPVNANYGLSKVGVGGRDTPTMPPTARSG